MASVPQEKILPIETQASRVTACACCGSTDLLASKVLWPSLIEEWALSEWETEYIDRQQGLRCGQCGSNLRSMALALAVCRCYGYTGVLAKFVRAFRARRLRVLEVNEAGGLTQFLSRLPRHQLVEYPKVSMTELPYRDRTHDLVVHSDTLEHVPNPIGGLTECYRVLVPGGYCAFTVPIIVDRMTRARVGLPPSYHGREDQRAGDLLVQTEYGCDAWKHLIQAGFDDIRLVALEFPSALAIVGARWK